MQIKSTHQQRTKSKAIKQIAIPSKQSQARMPPNTFGSIQTQTVSCRLPILPAKLDLTKENQIIKDLQRNRAPVAMQRGKISVRLCTLIKHQMTSSTIRMMMLTRSSYELCRASIQLSAYEKMIIFTCLRVKNSVRLSKQVKMALTKFDSKTKIPFGKDLILLQIKTTNCLLKP